MQTYEILVKERAVVANSRDMTLIRTSIGIDQVHVLFDNAEWLDFPITVTFAQGNDTVTQSLTVSAVTGSDEWVAEGTADVPWEVIDEIGPIRVTFQGTDAEGRHIITAAGAPLSVEQAGDVDEGLVPSDAPTIDQWRQAYAQAVVAANAANSLVRNLEDQIASMIADAESRIDDKIDSSYVIATEDRLGVIKVGDGLSITESGILSADATGSGMTNEQVRQLNDLVSLQEAAFEDSMVKSSALPVATMSSIGAVYPDGATITVADDGMLMAAPITIEHVATAERTGTVKPDGTTITIDQDGTIHGSSNYELPVATTSSIGGVKPDGTTISVDRDGTIAAIGSNVPIATTSVPGKVMPDGTTITVDQDGMIHGASDMSIDTVRFGYVGNSSYTSYAAIIGDESDMGYAFPNCTYVPESAFANYSAIVAADFPNATNMGRYAFYKCPNLTSVSLPTCLTIGSSAFLSCRSLAEVSIPSCHTIMQSAFYRCESLSEISIPRCSKIGTRAFWSCSTLVRVDLTGVRSVPSLYDRYVFYNTPLDTLMSFGYGSIYVPASLYGAFRSATGWSFYASRMVSV